MGSERSYTAQRSQSGSSLVCLGLECYSVLEFRCSTMSLRLLTDKRNKNKTAELCNVYTPYNEVGSNHENL